MDSIYPYEDVFACAFAGKPAPTPQKDSQFHPGAANAAGAGLPANTTVNSLSQSRVNPLPQGRWLSRKGALPGSSAGFV